MEFAPFFGVDNDGLHLIFPKEYDMVYDDDGNEWFFYCNEWSLCDELNWQLPDHDPLDYPPYDYDYDMN